MEVAKLFFEFVQGEKSIRMDDTDFVVLGYDGLEATDYDHVSEDNINGIGARLKKRKLLPRDIMIEWEYEGLEDKPQKRDELIGFFTPFSSGALWISYGDTTREIQYEVRSLNITTQNVHDYLAGALELVCMDPALLDDITESEIISTWMDGWVWRFTLPFRLRRRGNRTTTILNDGHMSAPVEIDFYGPAENPRVTNETTGEYIQVNRSLGEDDVLHITTAFGNKTVTIEHQGERTNAFHYIDLDTTFFELRQGKNLISYDTDNDLEPQGVEIRYRKRYLGI